MKVLELIKELQRCEPDENVSISMDTVDGYIEFYEISFVSLSGDSRQPVYINTAHTLLEDSNR